jgi:2'-5' RNA ligase
MIALSNRIARNLRLTSMPVHTIPAAHQSTASGAYTADEYQRRDAHKANTTYEDEKSYILALRTNENHLKTMTALRAKYFPKKINKLDAHVALFRALPGSELSRICNDISEIAGSTSPFSIHAKKPFKMGKGVGIQVDRAEPAKTIYGQLKERWEPFLSQQDKSFKAHYTIQNKVDDPTVVDNTIKEVREEFRGSEGTVDGLSLYRYDRGYWKMERDFEFGKRSSD